MTCCDLKLTPSVAAGCCLRLQDSASCWLPAAGLPAVQCRAALLWPPPANSPSISWLRHFAHTHCRKGPMRHTMGLRTTQRQMWRGPLNLCCESLLAGDRCVTSRLMAVMHVLERGLRLPSAFPFTRLLQRRKPLEALGRPCLCEHYLRTTCRALAAGQTSHASTQRTCCCSTCSLEGGWPILLL